MDQPELKASIIGQLLLMQSLLAGLPDEKTIFSFACRGLEDIPGVLSVRYAPATDTEAVANTVRLPLAVGASRLGDLVFELSDPAAFAPYRDYLNNFSFMMAVILEERSQRQQNQDYQHRLEKMVEDRTSRLLEVIRQNKEIEETLRRSEKLLNETQAISKTGGWDYDVASGKMSWSEETYRIHALPPDSAPGNIENNLAFYEPEDRDMLQKAFSGAVTSGTGYDLELRFVAADGTRKWVRTMG
jgi:PAS domain-containing protein